uniref:type IV secretion system protein n=1 Tax=Candidatus Bartonella washoeensis TaxID=186739 RepID=UPI003075C84A
MKQLTDKLGNAQTASEVQEIQAQLAAIQAKLQTQVLQMQTNALIQKAEDKAREERVDAEFRAQYKNYAKQLRSH